MPPPLEAFAADLLALLEAPDPCALRDRAAGTAGPSAVPAAVPAGADESTSNNKDLQSPGPLGPLGPRFEDVAGGAPADHDDEPAPALHPPRPADGRVQNCYSAWRTPEQHDAIQRFYAHHWRCTICRRAGQGYGDRCPEGAALLHAVCRAAVRGPQP